MERFRFEALITEEHQIKKLEKCLKDIPNIIDWKIEKLLNGILLSVNSIKLNAFDIALTLKYEGFVIERLYEE